MKKDMCEVIAEYENVHNIPAEERCTEYSTDFGFYIFKLDVDKIKINERYSGAKEDAEGTFVSDGRRMSVVLSATAAAASDESSYVMEADLQDEDRIITEFINTDARKKKLGLKIGEDTYYVLYQQKGSSVELLNLPFDSKTRYMARIDSARCRWLSKISATERSMINARIREITAGVAGMPEQSEGYRAEINARMRTVKSVFRNEEMSGYDFRGMDLTNAVFLFCRLTNANFSGCVLLNATFVGCEMPGCMFYGAELCGCRAYFNGVVLNLEDKSRHVF